MAQAYCFKCKTRTEIKTPLEFVMKNKAIATKGTCSVCGTKVVRIGKD